MIVHPLTYAYAFQFAFCANTKLPSSVAQDGARILILLMPRSRVNLGMMLGVIHRPGTMSRAAIGTAIGMGELFMVIGMVNGIPITILMVHKIPTQPFLIRKTIPTMRVSWATVPRIWLMWMVILAPYRLTIETLLAYSSVVSNNGFPLENLGTEEDLQQAFQSFCINNCDLSKPKKILDFPLYSHDQFASLQPPRGTQPLSSLPTTGDAILQRFVRNRQPSDDEIYSALSIHENYEEIWATFLKHQGPHGDMCKQASKTKFCLPTRTAIAALRTRV